VIQEISRAASAEGDASTRERMIAVGRWFEGAAAFPFASPYWWAGFVISGVPN
jgi:hypothetical protein